MMPSGRLRLRRFHFRAMGSPCELQIHADAAGAEQALQLVRDEVERLETKYSRYRPDSLLSRLNAAAGGPAQRVDEETAGLLDYAAQAYQQSEARFDPTAGVLRRVWDFRRGQPPEPAQIEALLPLIGWDRLRWQRPLLSLPAGMELDFGGFVKEYAADAAAARLRAAGLHHGLVSLGGDLTVVGPHPDGSAWEAGIRHPRDAKRILARIALSTGALASSGDYERAFIHQGRRYCHLLDARSGWPCEGLAAVSVVAPQCLVAGTAATIAMLLGAPDGPAWLADSGLSSLCVDSSGRMHGRLRGLQAMPDADSSAPIHGA